MAEPPPPRKRVSLTTLTVSSMIAGLAWGIFFGEHGVWVKWIGDAFVGLLQMTVLPYVAASLVLNVGRLQFEQGIRLARTALFVFALLWGIALVTLIIMSFAYPPWEAGSFFSSSSIESSESPDWLELFIPSNPFRSLANNLVPAVVVFSIGLGIALMNVRDKAIFLDPLEVAVEGLARLNKMVVKLSPVGIFAIIGHTAGSLSLEQFGLLQGYLLAHACAAVILSLWVLPALISCCTPFSQREVASHSRDALLAAFVIGNTFVVLPMIVDATKRLIAKHSPEIQTPDSSPEYAVQLAYPFPDLGRIVGLIFIPFAAWFYGTTIDFENYPALLGVGTIGAFAKPLVTIPLLLNLAELPGDIFNLFIAVGVVASRFGDLMKTMHLFTFGILTASILNGMFRVKWRRLVSYSIPTVIVFLVVVLGIRIFLDASFKDSFSKQDLVSARELRNASVASTNLETSQPNPDRLNDGEDPLERIRRRGIIRVGVRYDNLPFSYFNRNQELVGLDVDVAHLLARDLGVEIEFVPFDSDVTEPLRNDHFDIAMSGLEGTIQKATELPYTTPYMDISIALVAPDYRRREFKSVNEFRNRKDLRVAVIKNSKASESIRRFMQCTIVELNNEREYFESETPPADILATSAETGSAWTLLHPEYSVVRPSDLSSQLPLHYYVADQSQLREFLNEWLELEKRNGAIEELYEYWILGVDPSAQEPRWCVIRNVLGWVE